MSQCSLMNSHMINIQWTRSERISIVTFISEEYPLSSLDNSQLIDDRRTVHAKPHLLLLKAMKINPYRASFGHIQNMDGGPRTQSMDHP